MPNLPFNITSPSCKLWLTPGSGNNYQGYSCADKWLGAAAAQIPDNSPVQTCYDSSGNSNTLTQSASANAPLISQFASIAESPEPAMRFRSASSQFLPIPAGAKLGDGSPANEGTIIMCLRALPGLDGFPWSTGSIGIWPTGTAQLSIFNGSEHAFPNPFALNIFGPQPIAVRFNSAGTKFYGDTNYTDSIATNFLTGSVTGGFIGSLNGSGFFADMDLYDFAQFDQALSDADVLTVMQAMKDRVSPLEGQFAQVLAFGDSRTQGYNASNGVLPVARSWPARTKRALGGAGQWFSSAHAGDTIANQSTALTTFLTLLKPAIYSKRIVIGEVGVNDILAGSSAATIQSALTSLAAQIIAGGATHTIFLTIAPAPSITGAGETVRQTVNTWLKSGGIPNITVLDNAADPRLAVSGYYDPADGLHFLDPGYGVYAESATSALQPLFFNSTGSVNLNYGTFKAA
jgi:lysophospholipase L1-like esterase